MSNFWCLFWARKKTMGWKGILGFEYGIVQAPLGPDISSPHLVAAVANSGALGFLRVPDWVGIFPFLYAINLTYFIVFSKLIGIFEVILYVQRPKLTSDPA